jgi:hypothetical protein
MLRNGRSGASDAMKLSGGRKTEKAITLDDNPAKIV